MFARSLSSAGRHVPAGLLAVRTNTSSGRTTSRRPSGPVSVVPLIRDDLGVG